MTELEKVADPKKIQHVGSVSETGRGRFGQREGQAPTAGETEQDSQKCRKLSQFYYETRMWESFAA